MSRSTDSICIGYATLDCHETEAKALTDLWAASLMWNTSIPEPWAEGLVLTPMVHRSIHDEDGEMSYQRVGRWSVSKPPSDGQTSRKDTEDQEITSGAKHECVSPAWINSAPLVEVVLI